MQKSYFSISFNMIVTDQEMPYDLYVNASAIESKERFIRIFKKGDVMTRMDLTAFMVKYPGVYAAEEDRNAFLKTLCAVNGATVADKAVVLKEVAIHHIENVFESGGDAEVVSRSLSGCKDVMESMIDVLQDYNVDNLSELIADLSYHDFYTYNHSINVAIYSMMLYKSFNPRAPREKIFLAGMSGLMHDLGKSKISTEILNKDGKLTDMEFAEIKKHPTTGFKLLQEARATLPKELNVDILERVVLEHHENVDGTGYPSRLPAEKIHVLSKIVAICDFFDAITTKRPYHEPRTLESALELMRRESGKKIDSDLFLLFSEKMLQTWTPEKQLTLPQDFELVEPAKLPEKKTLVLNPEQDYGKVKVIGGAAKPVPAATGFGKVRVVSGNPGKKKPAA